MHLNFSKKQLKHLVHDDATIVLNFRKMIELGKRKRKLNVHTWQRLTGNRIFPIY